jgi:hypothetical protein
MDPMNHVKAKQDFEWALRDRGFRFNMHTFDEVWEVVSTLLQQHYDAGYDKGYAEGIGKEE